MKAKTIKATATHDNINPIYEVLEGAQISKLVFKNHFFLSDGTVPSGRVHGFKMISPSFTGVLIKS